MVMKHAEVSLAGFSLSAPVMNAACPKSKTIEDVRALIEAPVGAIVVGSITVNPREQNIGKVYWRHHNGLFTLNSYGLPNGGLPYYKNQLPTMVDIAHKHGKLLIANVIGFSEDEFCNLIKLAQDSGVDIVELNFGCPNVWEGSAQKRIISYHASLVRSMLQAIKASKPQIKISVKISPLPPDILAEVADAITESGVVQAVTATNTFPNATALALDGTTIDPGAGLAGLSGPALKPITLGIISQLKQLLPADIDIIAAGGVSDFGDMADYLQAGAKAVQVASAFMAMGPGVFSRILAIR
jgi:dihydroorotate dehydrogenase